MGIFSKSLSLSMSVATLCPQPVPSPCHLTTPNGTAILSPTSPVDASGMLLDFLEDPDWQSSSVEVDSISGSASSNATMEIDEALVTMSLESMMHEITQDAEPSETSSEQQSVAAPPPRTRRGHRRSASAPSVLGKRERLTGTTPVAPKSKKNIQAAHSQAASEIQNSLTNMNSGPSLSFSLKQGKEGSRDGGATHPTWIRSNMRATWGHLCIHCANDEESSQLERLLRNGTASGDYHAASLEFKLCYEGGDDVELLEKKGGNLADRLKLITPTGNVEQGICMPDTSIAYHTHHHSSKQAVKPHFFQFDSRKFPWDKKAKPTTDNMLELGLKFATNVTTRAHDKRRFIWQVDLSLYGADGQRIHFSTTRTAPFAYLPRNPEKSTVDFRLDDVISDGQPGDLLVCGGSGVGFVDRPNLVACVQGSGGFEMRLPRQGTAKSTFVTRWPADMPAGKYKIHLINEDGTGDEITESVAAEVSNGAVDCDAL